MLPSLLFFLPLFLQHVSNASTFHSTVQSALADSVSTAPSQQNIRRAMLSELG